MVDSNASSEPEVPVLEYSSHPSDDHGDGFDSSSSSSNHSDDWRLKSRQQLVREFVFKSTDSMLVGFIFHVWVQTAGLEPAVIRGDGNRVGNLSPAILASWAFLPAED